MGRRAIDFTGETMGYLTAIEPAGKRGNKIAWRCKCRCGNETIIASTAFGRTISCGCVKRTAVGTANSLRFKNYHRSALPEYQSWRSMLDRCYRPKMVLYARYGGRGITVCDRWRGKEGFNNFLADMGHRPEGLTLYRRDNSGNYEPGNCRWATAKEQNNNRIISPEGRAASLAALDAGRKTMWSDPARRARLEADRKQRPHKPNGDFAKSGA